MDSQLERLCIEYWEFQLREDPLAASVYYGDHRYDDRLPAAGDADFQRRRDTLQGFRTRLEQIDHAVLDPQGASNAALLARQVTDAIAEYDFRSYLLPISKSAAFYDVFMEVPASCTFSVTEDYEQYCSRLRGFKQFVEAHIDLMRLGLREGYIPVRATLSGVEDSIRAHIVADATASRLWAPFARFPATVRPAERTRLADEARAAIMGSVVPAFEALLRYVRDEYVPHAREDVAASSLPDGQAFYQHRIRSQSTLDLTPEQVHAAGIDEVARIRSEMLEVMATTGFAGSFAEFLAFLRRDPRFYVQTPEALLREVAYILKRADGALPALFRTLPRTPYGLKPVPEALAPGTPTAYYQPLAGDGTRAGYYFVNTYDLPSRPLYELEALSLHEAVPGHHLQLALQAELEAVPAFRRFASFTAYVEGWALYAERLGLEMGFYQDPYSNFGRLTYEMWRACRLVVDTGMHAFGWSRQRAIDFMREHTALTLLNIRNEVDRYIAWPGQALAYKLGEMKLRSLRARCEAALGSRFDLRAFHDIILGNGAIPLDMLEANVEGWLAQLGAHVRPGTPTHETGDVG